MNPSAPAAWRGRLARSLRWHGLAFAALNLLLTAANFASGPPWWALWPLVASGFLLATHYLLCKSLGVNDRWVEERALELNLKSYDRSHIEDIKARQADPQHGRTPKQG